jgi:hypothetical protein
MKSFFVVIISLLVFATISCSQKQKNETFSQLEIKMNSIAENYVRLALQIGKYDPDFVDAYFGPDSLKPPADTIQFNSTVFEDLNQKVNKLLDEMESLAEFPANKLERQRYSYLYKQLLACKTRIYMLNGMTLTFDEELNALYDIQIDYKDEEYFNQYLDELDRLLPGEGNIYDRYIKYRENFRVPEEKLKSVFNLAINECRIRTNKHLKLPPNEKFDIQFVNNKPWSAYNWFKGNSYSLIEVNTDLPIYVDRIIDLAAHEGYPGHHIHHTMLEWQLYKKRNWIEFSIYLLFSPQSLIAEGVASYGPELLFSEDERIKFDKEIIFTQSGLDSSKADLYYKIIGVINKLNHSINTAAKNYLDGKWDEKKTIDWIKKYNLRTEESAKKLIDFIKRYRTYIVNYSAGYDLVKSYLETKNSVADRWKLFDEIISTPMIPSHLEKSQYETKN